MEASLYSIEKLLQENAFYEIPKFQRTYAWRQREWDAFWQTTAGRALQPVTGDSAPPLFMGVLVLQSGSSEKVGTMEFQKYNIIDGQQRMATISVFFAVARDFYFGTEHEKHFEWTNLFQEINVDFMGYQPKQRLLLQKEDEKIYRDLIKRKTKSEWETIMMGTHALEELYQFFWAKMSAKTKLVLEEIAEQDDASQSQNDEEITSSQDDPPEQEKPTNAPYLEGNTARNWQDDELFDPKVLVPIVYQQMRFAVVKIKPEDSEISFEVFETLNAQGQKLDEVDKFRNGYFMLDPANSEQNWRNFWKPLEEKSGTDLRLLSTFFQEEAIRRFGWTAKQRVYTTLMTDIRKNAGSVSARDEQSRAAAIKREFTEIRTSFDAFQIAYKGIDSLANPTSTEESNYILLLDYLSKLTGNPKIPLVMDVLRWTQRNRTDVEIRRAVNEIFNSLATLLTRRLVGGVKAQQLRSLLSRLPYQIRNKIKTNDPTFASTPENLALYNQELNRIMMDWEPSVFPTDWALMSDPLRDIYNTTGRKTALLAVLWDVERSINNERCMERTPVFRSGVANWTIEHVLPQGKQRDGTSALNEAWKQDWARWGVKNPDQDFPTSVHAIGNLTLLWGPDNTAVSDRCFAEKKEIYSNRTRFMLTDDIKNKEIWTRSEIQERSEAIIKKICDKWPYPDLTSN